MSRGTPSIRARATALLVFLALAASTVRAATGERPGGRFDHLVVHRAGGTSGVDARRVDELDEDDGGSE